MYFYIDNTPIYNYKEYKSFTIIQFCDLLYLVIPRFCYHDKLSIAGNCRMCLVEMNNGIKPVVACATNIGGGIELALNSLLVKKSRENVLEFLLINHPLDCPICDQGGECDLQDQTVMYGSDRGRFKEMKRSVEDKDLGPVVKTIMTRCIHCTRCIRFSDEVLGIRDLGIIGRGSSSEIKMNNVFFLDSELSGNIVDVCPVGALTSKPFAFTARSWDLKSIESIDLLDSLHSNIRVDIKGNRILRVLPRNNQHINECWISDYIRFSYESIQSFRIKYPFISINKGFFNFLESDISVRLGWEQCFEFFKLLFNLKNTYSFSFFTSSGIGLFNVNFFYYMSRFIKNSTFNIESLPSFDIDSRSSYLINSFSDYMKSNFYIFYNVNIKNNFSVFYSRMYNYIINSFYKKHIFFIGSNQSVSYPSIQTGNSLLSFVSLLRGKNLNNSFFYRVLQRDLSINTFSSDVSISNYVHSLNIFNSVSNNNMCFYSNISGYFENGINSDLRIPSFFGESLSYYYKTSKVQKTDSFFLYHGNYLPSLEQNDVLSNYIFMPSSNMFEVEDTYLNIFGDYQKGNQVIDFSEKEEVKSDFYILKNIFASIFFFSGSFNASNVFYSFDYVFNELVFFYFNYFVLFFSYFPLYTKHAAVCSNVDKKHYFFKFNISNLEIKTSFFVSYSSTLRSFYKQRNSKQLSSFN